MQMKEIQCQLQATRGSYREIQPAECVSTPGNQAAIQKGRAVTPRSLRKSPASNRSGIKLQENRHQLQGTKH